MMNHQSLKESSCRDRFFVMNHFEIDLMEKFFRGVKLCLAFKIAFKNVAV